MIQIDMPMPTNCLDCPACNEYLTCAIPVSGRKWGENDVREFDQGRPEWCPLKEQEAKIGHWIDTTQTIGFPRCKCSVCNSEAGAIWMHYCPICGVKMKQEGR